MRGWVGYLRGYFYQQDQEFVVLRAEEQGGCLSYYVQADGIWQRKAQSMAMPETAGDSADSGEDDALGKLAEWAALEIAKKGWQKVPLLYVLPEQEMIGYVLNLPPALTAAQQEEAAFWEIDDKLAARGLGADAFAFVCETLAENAAETRCAMMGVRRDYLQEVRAAFARAELVLEDVLIPDEHDNGGAGKPPAYLLGKVPGFFRRPARRLAGRRLLAVWLLVMGLILGIWAAYDLYGWAQAKGSAEARGTELVRLAPEKQEMEAAETICQQIENREHLLQALQEKGIPWYSVLVHLGCHTTEGVYITDLEIGNAGSQLRLEGRAVNYDALAEFVGSLEQDRAFFPQGAILEDSSLDKGRDGSQIRFSLTINWETGTGHDESMGKNKDI